MQLFVFIFTGRYKVLPSALCITHTAHRVSDTHRQSHFTHRHSLRGAEKTSAQTDSTGSRDHMNKTSPSLDPNTMCPFCPSSLLSLSCLIPLFYSSILAPSSSPRRYFPCRHAGESSSGWLRLGLKLRPSSSSRLLYRK